MLVKGSSVAVAGDRPSGGATSRSAGPDWSRPRVAPANGVLVVARRLLLVAGVLVATCVVGWGVLAASPLVAAHPGASLVAAAVTLVFLAVGRRRRRDRLGWDGWVAVDPGHKRGSCGWRISRGLLAGQPCPACWAWMSRRERRAWLAAHPHLALGTVPVRVGTQSGSTQTGWVLLITAGILAGLGAVQGVAGGPLVVAGPLLLAGAVLATVTVATHPLRTPPASPSAAVGPRPLTGVAVCESCRMTTARTRVRFGDGTVFELCQGCADTAHDRRVPAGGVVA